MTTTVQAQQRTNSTRGQLRKLRMSGQIPAIVYGKQAVEATSLSVSERQISQLLRTHTNAVLNLEVPGAGTQSVMIAEIQREPLSGQMIHIDFHQISMNEKVRTDVRIDVTGESVGVREGGIYQLILHEVEVQCLPGDIPEQIMADITNLAVGESLLVSDLFFPSGIEVRTDASAVVVTVLAPQKDEEPEDDKTTAPASELQAETSDT